MTLCYTSLSLPALVTPCVDVSCLRVPTVPVTEDLVTGQGEGLSWPSTSEHQGSPGPPSPACLLSFSGLPLGRAWRHPTSPLSSFKICP